MINALYNKENSAHTGEKPPCGLTHLEVERSRQKYGRNVLPKGKRESFIKRFIVNLGDPIIRILLFALLINVIFIFRDGNIFAHRYHTGVSNEKILKNFSILARSGLDFVVRVPLIPSVTDTRENIAAIAQILLQNGVDYVELLPYNKMAGGKYKMIMREYEPTFDHKREVELHLDIFDKNGIAYKIL